MSHFAVLVIGASIRDQLARYDENLEIETIKDGDESYSINPDAKWDWYEIGGRWTGYLKLKAGTQGKCGRPGLLTKPAEEGRADSTQIQNVDIQGMRDEAEEKAKLKYDTMLILTDGKGLNKPSVAWEDLCKREDLDWDQRRTLYAQQPEIVAFDAMRVRAREKWEQRGLLEDSVFEELSWESGPMELSMTREQYLQNARDHAFVTFAVVKGGEWYEKGKMGWWACVSDEKDQDTWSKEFAKLIDGLDPTTLITIVDCHIWP